MTGLHKMSTRALVTMARRFRVGTCSIPGAGIKRTYTRSGSSEDVEREARKMQERAEEMQLRRDELYVKQGFLQLEQERFEFNARYFWLAIATILLVWAKYEQSLPPWPVKEKPDAKDRK